MMYIRQRSCIQAYEFPEEAMRIAEEQLHAMIERHHAVMLVVDLDSGVTVDANRAGSRFYGKER